MCLKFAPSLQSTLRLWGAGCTLLAVALAIPAAAVPITVQFSGLIVSVNDPLGDLTGTGIQPNVSTFTGEFTYDPDAAATALFLNFADYPAIEFSILIDGTHSVSAAPPTGIQISNDDGTFFDSFAISAQTGTVGTSTTLPNLDIVSAQLRLTDFTNALFTSTALPATLDLSDFDLRTITIVGFRNDGIPGNDYFITGLVVPEPSTLVLVGTGLGLLGLHGRKQRTRGQLRQKRG